ncbi:MAG: carbohydrate binding domain-containing protein [Thermoguttaceae bacterium]|nr:carbohydrate binding domain-containing protein [Thermoguttaceae bacterium]
MRNTRRFGALAFVFLFSVTALLAFTAGASAQQWKSGDGDGGALWPARVSITVENPSDSTLETFVPVAVDTLPIAGQKVDSLRLFDPKGGELIFELTGADGESVHRGTVPQKGALTIPVKIEPKSSGVYTLCFGNEKSFPLADWLTVRTEIVNGGFESVKNETPVGWRFDAGDAQHHAGLDTDARSGKYSVKTTVAEGAKPTWIAARQGGLSVTPGQRWRLSGFVKGRNIKGYSGWYTHVGNSKNSMVGGTLPRTEKSDFDWTEISQEFTIPEDCDTLEFGTVLYGTGTAWYDDLTLQRLDDQEKPLYTVTVGETESIPYQTFAPEGFDPAGPETFDISRYGFNKASRWAVVRRINEGDAAETMMFLSAAELARRIGYDSGRSFSILTPAGEVLRPEEWNSLIFFPAALPARSVSYFLAVEESQSPKGFSAAADTGSSSAALPGTMQQTDTASNSEGGAEPDDETLAGDLSYPAFFEERNLVANGVFAGDGPFPDGWKSGKRDGYTCQRWTEGDKSGVEISADEEAARHWVGLRQSVPVQGGSTYFVAVKVKTLEGKPYQMYYHQHTAGGSLSSGGMCGTKHAPGGAGWKILYQTISTAPDTAQIELHLTLGSAGRYRITDLVFLPMADTGKVITLGGGTNGVFQVPSVVKVFPETVFSADREPISPQNPAVVCAARNEDETLQLAFREEQDGLWRIDVQPPVCESNQTLPRPEAGAVGYVPVNYPTSYYHLPYDKSCLRQIPTASPSSDGWAGLWPDPVIPIALDGAEAPSAFDPAGEYDNDSHRLAAAGKSGLLELTAGRARSLWLTIHVPADAAPGLYTGQVLLTSLDGRTKRVYPYRVRVFSTSLPDQPASGATYDLRSDDAFLREGETAKDVRKRLIEFMAKRKISPDTIPVAPPLKYDPQTGQTSCDWTEFDETAEWYFDQLHVRWSYAGWFYEFGWGLPPKSIEGVNPYPGEYPYPDADRAVLNDDYKKVYQSRLACFWNHMKEKGWQDRFVLYLSDEPFYSNPDIIKQMKAICDMIHEVDPAIPIYVSSWRHIPEWDGSIDVWGIGHYGIVPPEQLEKSKRRGDSYWWTTDGQMCLDTPYSAIERMLPWWCWRWGADAYEFWGATWYTYNPFDFGWHRYIFQSDTPTNKYFVRYPDGDGYIIYPGSLIGLDEIITSVRCDAARDGQEDALLLAALDAAIQKQSDSGQSSEALEKAKSLREKAASLVPIPARDGKVSTEVLPNPEILDLLKEQIGEVLEELE